MFQGQVFLTPVPGSSCIGLCSDINMNIPLETGNAYISVSISDVSGIFCIWFVDSECSVVQLDALYQHSRTQCQEEAMDYL